MSKETADTNDKPKNPPARTQVILLVADPKDAGHGEVKVFDDPQEAERMIETLLEAGLEPERFRVFTGAETEIAVSYRPVVDLTGEGSEQTAASEPAKRGDNGHDTKGARISGVFQGAADEAQ
jgi:predicted signal transduction protein with EAL and GGDEF domain